MSKRDAAPRDGVNNSHVCVCECCLVCVKDGLWRTQIRGEKESAAKSENDSEPIKVQFDKQFQPAISFT